MEIISVYSYQALVAKRTIYTGMYIPLQSNWFMLLVLFLLKVTL